MVFAALLMGPMAASGAELDREQATVPLTMAAPLSKPQVGERLSFQGHWMGIPVGGGWIEVKLLTEFEGRPAYLIEAEGKSNRVLSTFYPIEDHLRSYLDAETLQPLQFEKTQREGNYRADEVIQFDYAAGEAHYRSLLNRSTKTIPIPPGVHDLISAFYWMRTHDSDPSKPVELDLYSDEKIYRAEIRPVKTLMLELLRRGTFPCLMVEPAGSFKGVFVRRGRMWVYVTVDERRLPVLVKISTPWGLMTGVLDKSSINAASGGR